MLTRVCDIISNEKFTKNYIEFSKILGLGILEVKMPSMKFYIKERIDRDLKKINRYNKKSFLEYNDISDFIPYKLWFIETFFIDWTIWSTNNCNVMDITKFKFVDKEYKDIK